MSYDNSNRGALWVNDKREKDTHPQLQGQAEVDGVEYWVSAWTSKDGGKKPVVSMTFKRKDQERAPRPKPEQSAEQEYHDSGLSDLPF